MPTLIRDSAFSWAAWAKQFQVRVEPAGTAVVEVIVTVTQGPNRSVSAWTLDQPEAECPETWSGCGGVGRSGVHVGSAGSVAGLPSVSASRIAVIGRH